MTCLAWCCGLLRLCKHPSFTQAEAELRRQDGLRDSPPEPCPPALQEEARRNNRCVLRCTEIGGGGGKDSFARLEKQASRPQLHNEEDFLHGRKHNIQQRLMAPSSSKHSGSVLSWLLISFESSRQVELLKRLTDLPHSLTLHSGALAPNRLTLEAGARNHFIHELHHLRAGGVVE